MPKSYRLRTQQFCNLSKEQTWQSWLHTVAPDLCKSLLDWLRTSTSCRGNQTKMMEIYAELIKRKLHTQLIKFMQSKYPLAVEEVIEIDPNKPTIQTSQTIVDNDTTVFASYRPGLLTFPQKMIFENTNQIELEKDVHNFLSGKINGDYIIIGNRAYVEYFKLKFAREAQHIKAQDREIMQYRLKHGMKSTDKIANISQGDTNEQAKD